MKTPQKSPLEKAREREVRLSKGLQDLAATYGHEIRRPYINALGEFPFNVDGGYGEGLAARLNTIPVRFGINPCTGFVQGHSAWCRINHFDVERLLQS